MLKLLARAIAVALAAMGLVLSSPAYSQEELTILNPGGSGAASNLSEKCDCREGTRDGYATLAWEAATASGSEQRIQVTIYGWDRAMISPSLPADATSFEWTEMNGQAIHEWRVLTRHSDSWVPSNKSSFEGVTCTKDGVD
jgi:hypothetical protein